MLSIYEGENKYGGEMQLVGVKMGGGNRGRNFMKLGGGIYTGLRNFLCTYNITP